MLREGRGVSADSEAAFRWLSAAASQKVGAAYLLLAELYAAGEGTARDPLRAYAYAEAALRRDYDDDDSMVHYKHPEKERAEALRSQLAKELSGADRQAAERIAEEIVRPSP
jgi:TPR repeat protein